MTTFYVTGDGTGDYNCDGSADNVEINQALSYAAINSTVSDPITVYLRGPFIYDIQATLLIGSNTIFSGDSTAVLRLNNSLMWASGVPIIGQRGASGEYAAGIQTVNVEISGFQIDANEINLTHEGVGTPERIHGNGYYNQIYFLGSSSARCSNISVYGMKLYDSMGDGLRINYAENVLVSNCEMYNLQHSSIFLMDVIGAEICDCDIKHITCAGVRLDNCQDVIIHESVIADWTGTTSAWAGGSNGIQIGAQPATYGHTTLSQNIEVYNCDIQGGGCGICLMDAYQTAGTTAQTVYIHNNEIHDSGDGNAAAYFSGISVWSWGNGLNIQYNNIADNFNAGILIYGCFQSGSTAYVANNNILDTVQAGTTGGYGIRNLVNTKMTVQAVNNYLSGNILGKYYQVTPTSEASSSILTAGIIEETVIVPDDPDDPVTPPTNTTPSTYTAIGDRVLLLPIQGGGYVLLKIVTNAR